MSFIGEGQVQHRDRNLFFPRNFAASTINASGAVANFTVDGATSITTTWPVGSAVGDFATLWIVHALGSTPTFPSGWDLRDTITVQDGALGGVVYFLSRTRQAGDPDPVYTRTAGAGAILSALVTFNSYKTPIVIPQTKQQNNPASTTQNYSSLPGVTRNAFAVAVGIKAAPDIVGWASFSGIAPNFNYSTFTWNEGAASAGNWAVCLNFGRMLTRNAVGLVLNQGTAAVGSNAMYIIA